MASSEKNYHVFVSFRGTDVRNNFLCDLYAALNQKGIYTFVDSQELRKGEQISLALMRAIEESHVAIIIFSENYASSRWCLEELAKIMECKAQENKLIVLPVFYKVEPREVRGLKEGYGTAMAMHESDVKKDPEMVKRWKKALSDAGHLSGWVFNYGDEAELIRSILRELSIHLGREPFHVANYQVGIDSRVQEVKVLSEKELEDDDVLMIGLWGPGGIGKTTIAKSIYNTIERQFWGSCFLHRVRETSNKSNGLVDLQRQLLSEILYPRDITVYTKDGGINLIRERLHRKKVLLVLDDVDHSCQLDALAGGGNWFGKGSRIFVTTRDKHLVTSSHCMNCVYPVKPLDHDEALDLFVWHAFQNSKKSEIRKDLINRALHCASGLPLALEVLGSFLHGKEEPEWESALAKLSKSPNTHINQVLKISFDGLENDEKDIFLDIACFFKGKSIEYIKKVLNSCGFETTIGIKVLIDKSLIRKEHGTLQMHDLVQSMGQNFVNEKYTDDPGKRSRLWLFEDVQDILCEDMETNEVKAIVLDLPAPEERTMSPEEITISPNAFKNMKMLRMLILIGVHISSQGPIYLPNKLRWLEWPNAPFLEFGSGPKKLVGLDIQKSHIRQFDGKLKNFKWLTYMNFNQCKYLVSVPDLSSIPNLESLNLDGCESLVEVHQSVTCHDKLKFLSLHFCSNLSNFPHTLKAKSLQALDLFGCSKFEKFPDISENMEHLKELDLSWTAIKELPASVENLVSIKIINLKKCKSLRTLPSNIYKLQNLEHLHLGGCSKFFMFPKNLEDSTNPNGNLGFQNLIYLILSGCDLSEVDFLESSSSFPQLGYLNLSRNKFTHLPTRINEYHNLEHLVVEKCKQLQKIPQLPPNVHELKANGCRSLQEFPDFSSLSSNCRQVELLSCRELFHKGANTAGVLSLKELRKMTRFESRLSGREMPEWFFHCKDSSVSFMVPGDLSDKFLGVAICVVFGLEEGKAVDAECDISIDGDGWFSGTSRLCSMKSDSVLTEYLTRSDLHIEGELPRDDWSHFEVRLSVSKGRLIKWGLCPINEQEEDDRRIVLQHHQPNETDWSSEETDSEEDNWIDTKEDWEETDSEEDNWIDAKEEESSSEKDDESNEEKLSQPNETNWSSEERDLEEDNWIDTEEEESSSEIDCEINKEEVFEILPRSFCGAAGSACRSYNLNKKLILGSPYRRKRYIESSYRRKSYIAPWFRRSLDRKFKLNR